MGGYRGFEEEEALLGAVRAMVAISLGATAELPVRVSVVQLRAITVLSLRPGPNLGELAAALGLSVSATSRLCDRLVDAGWLVRRPSPRTRREIALYLTGAGRALLAAYDRARLDTLTAALDRLDPARRGAVVAAFAEFAAAARPGEQRA